MSEPARPPAPEPRVRLFVTGGTFDKEYDEIRGELYFRDTHVPEMLALGRSKLAVDVRTLMMIDSLEMSDDDRAIVVEHCRKAKESRIVITHGTDTMEVTARVLAEARITGKTIVLTGAMIPFKFGSSDGLFNLGSALAFAQALPAGVYVAMNGRIFAGERVHKNKATGEFVEEFEGVGQSMRGGPCRIRFKGALVSNEKDASSHHVAPASA